MSDRWSCFDVFRPLNESNRLGIIRLVNSPRRCKLMRGELLLLAFGKGSLNADYHMGSSKGDQRAATSTVESLPPPPVPSSPNEVPDSCRLTVLHFTQPKKMLP